MPPARAVRRSLAAGRYFRLTFTHSVIRVDRLDDCSKTVTVELDLYRIVTCGHALLKTATPQGSSPGGGHSVALPETRPLAHQMHAPEFWQRLLWGVRQGGKCWPTKTLVPGSEA